MVSFHSPSGGIRCDPSKSIIPSDILKTGKAFKRESLLMGDGEPTTADKYNKEWIDNEKTKT